MDNGMFDNPFNYSLEDNTLKRRQQIRDLLRQQASGPGQAQFVQNGVGTFYAGGNSIGENLAKLGSQLILNHKDKKGEQQRTDLDNRESQRRAAALDILQGTTAKRLAAEDAARAAEQQAAIDAGETNELPEVVVRPKGPSKEQALAVLRQGNAASQGYASDYEDKKGLFAPPAPPPIEFHDGYLINTSTGESKRVTPEKVETYEDVNGDLRNKQTGELVKKVGKAADPKAIAKENAAAIEEKSSFESADADLQGTINEMRLILENKGNGSVEDTAGAFNMVSRNNPFTKDYDTKFNIERAMAQKIIGSLKQMKAAGVGTSAFNSDKEAERMEKAFGAINWNSKEEARRQLNNIYSDLLDTQKRGREAYAASKKAHGGGIAPSGGISLGDF
jgi:hypothetical protein